MNFQIVIDSLAKIATDILNFIPNLINGLIILFIGYLVSLLVGRITNFVLRRAKFDALVDKAGVTGGFKIFEIKTSLSQIISRTIFVLLLLSFLITSTRIMGLEPVARLFERLLMFVPTLIAALIFFLLGCLIAQFVGNMTAAVAGGSGIGNAARLGKLIQFIIILFVVIISLGIMGLDTGLLVTSATIVIATFGLAFGLAGGFGAKRIVRHVLAGYYLKQRFQSGQIILIEQTRGTVAAVGSANTVIETADGIAIFPNEMLLESIIVSPRAPTTAESESIK
jgi:small-conductance mechanosensitive channel